MKRPNIDKSFSDLLTRQARRVTRKLIIGSSLAGLGLASFGQVLPGKAIQSNSGSVSVFRIRNKEERTGTDKLILTLGGEGDQMVFAQHRSHSSHRSHRSHSSHRSHYSSRTGTRPAPPPPRSPPPPPPPRRPPAKSTPSPPLWSPHVPPARDLSMTEDEAHQVVIEITKIDLKRTYDRSTVSGKDRHGNPYIFHFLPQTQLRRLTPREAVQPLSEILSGKGRVFPLVEKQDVLVAWKTQPLTERKVAVKFTVY